MPPMVKVSFLFLMSTLLCANLPNLLERERLKFDRSRFMEEPNARGAGIFVGTETRKHRNTDLLSSLFVFGSCP
jgi:hypothetical protein